MPMLRVYGCNASNRIVHAEYVECEDLAAAWRLARPMLADYPAVEMWNGDKRLFRVGRDSGDPALEVQAPVRSNAPEADTPPTR